MDLDGKAIELPRRARGCEGVDTGKVLTSRFGGLHYEPLGNRVFVQFSGGGWSLLEGQLSFKGEVICTVSNACVRFSRNGG